MIFCFFFKCLFADFQAQELMEATLYEEASLIFEKQIQEDHSHKLSLAKCYFALERFGDVIELLINSSQENEEKYLLALAYQRVDNHEAAIALLSQLPKAETVLYDVAVSHYYLKEYNLSESLLNELALTYPKSKLLDKASIYLIKIDLEKGFFDAAEKKLQTLLGANKDQEIIANFRFLEGDLYFRKKQYEKAIACFEAIIPKRNKTLAPWYKETLYQLGWSYLKLAEAQSSEEYFKRAEQAFYELAELSKEEKVYLSYAEVLLSKGKHLGDEQSYKKAHQILCEDKIFTTKDGKNKSLFMLAEAASEYDDREKLYAELIDSMQKKGLELAESWYLRGVNEWEEGQYQKNRMQNVQAKKHFKRATDFLKKAHELYNKYPLKEALSLKFIAMSYLSQNGRDDVQEAIQYLTLCIQQGSVSLLEDPLEIYYLKALAEMEIKDKVDLKAACCELESGIASYKKGAFLDKATFLLGQMYHQCGDFENAEKTFLKIPLDFPSSPLCPQAYYGASLSVQDAKQDDALVKQYKQILYEKYPDSPIAAEGYFTYYSYNEYLQGDRKALKHLQSLTLKFPRSVFSLNAYYLLGMDLKRDRKSPQGKWISKKNLTQSVEAFANVESCFDTLFNEDLIPLQKLDYYIYLRYRAILERALANYAIAEESKGAKRQIYLEYAGEVFKKILTEFQDGNHTLAQKIKEKELFSKIVEESYYYLAKIYWQTDNADLADKVYSEAMKQYQNSHITKSYFLAKLLIERGFFAFAQEDFSEALLYFKRAGEAGNGKILNSDETLDLLIQQSLCLQQTHQLEEAMLLLSQVINCDIASSLRLKAMFLRAGIYEKQGRLQLAKRQLETIVAKGGDWAQMAQEKLEKDYGFY